MAEKIKTTIPENYSQVINGISQERSIKRSEIFRQAVVEHLKASYSKEQIAYYQQLGRSTQSKHSY